MTNQFRYVLWVARWKMTRNADYSLSASGTPDQVGWYPTRDAAEEARDIWLRAGWSTGVGDGLSGAHW